MKILVTDDHPIMREALKIALASMLPDGEIICAGTLGEAVSLARAHEPTLAILDLGLPGQSGIGSLTSFREQVPEVPVVVFSALDDRATVLSALDAGAMGFIPKTVPSDVLMSALRIVFAGAIYVPPEALDGGSAPTVDRPAPPRPEEFAALTPRQREVMQLLLQGHSNKRICRQLSIAENTVKVHVSAVLRALNAENRTQAVLAASRLGVRMPLSP
ncbi:MAG: bacterial regulatory s, luxR family protein [Betaproteobacteria bacterium]|nr:bacterial regulatory s, luxR family protein [Betaproteobacteria bacterium]